MPYPGIYGTFFCTTLTVQVVIALADYFCRPSRNGKIIPVYTVGPRGGHMVRVFFRVTYRYRFQRRTRIRIPAIPVLPSYDLPALGYPENEFFVTFVPQTGRYVDLYNHINDLIQPETYPVLYDAQGAVISYHHALHPSSIFAD